MRGSITDVTWTDRRVGKLRTGGQSMSDYNVKDYGAVGDGVKKDTAAIQKAIDVCCQNGGGRVVLDGGEFLSGTLYLKTGVTLEITASAVLWASPDIGDYGRDTYHNRYRNESALDRCFIYAEDAERIGLAGEGTICGNAGSFPNKDSIYRSMLIRFLRCENIRLEKLHLYESAAWTTAFLDSSYIWIRGLDIRNEQNYNGDGLDFDGCSHIWVSECNIRGTDDNLCLQSSGRIVEDVHIANCSFSSLCAGIRIGLKSIGNIRDVAIINCTMKNIWREGIKIECSEGGSITDILIQNIVMRNVRRPLFLLLNNRFAPEDYGSSIELDHMPAIGSMERILISNLTAIDEECMSRVHYRFGNDIMGRPEFNGIRIDADREHLIRSILLENIYYRSIGGVKLDAIPGEYPRVPDRTKQNEEQAYVSENYYPDWSRAAFADIRNVEGLELHNVRFQWVYPDERVPWFLEECRDVSGEMKLV